MSESQQLTNRHRPAPINPLRESTKYLDAGCCCTVGTDDCRGVVAARTTALRPPIDHQAQQARKQYDLFSSEYEAIFLARTHGQLHDIRKSLLPSLDDTYAALSNILLIPSPNLKPAFSFPMFQQNHTTGPNGQVR